MWNENLFLVKDCITNQRSISVAGVLVNSGKQVVLCNVYAPTVEKDRLELWEFILKAQQSIPFSMVHWRGF